MKKKFIASAIIMAVSLTIFIVLAAIVYNYQCNPLKSFRETPGIDVSVRDYFFPSWEELLLFLNMSFQDLRNFLFQT